MEAMICAMTPQSGGVHKSSMAGAGMHCKWRQLCVAELNNLLQRFGQMQKMMRKMGKMQKMMGKMGGKMAGKMAIDWVAASFTALIMAWCS